MADAKTSLVINGVDNTAGAFASVAARASAVGARMRGMLGGALAAAGAYLGFNAVKSGINELGHLSDIATKANMSVEDLTKTSLAMDVMGIQRMGIDEFAKALDYMQKTTGRVGMEGFYATLQELAAIEDRSKRGQRAMAIFGRTGMELMPVINGVAANGVGALRNVVDAMPGITQAASTSGDNVADAMGIATAGVKSIWLQAIGAVCGYFDSMFVSGIQGAALMACGWLEYYAKLGSSYFVSYFKMAQNAMSELFGAMGTVAGTLWNGGGFGEALEAGLNQWQFDHQANIIDETAEQERLDRRVAAWKAAYEERKALAEKFTTEVNKAAISASGEETAANAAAPGAGAGAAAAKRAQVRNTLILGGTNEAAKLAAFGPTYQSEAKKQTALLQKISKNTEKIVKEERDPAAPDDDGMPGIVGE